MVSFWKKPDFHEYVEPNFQIMSCFRLLLLLRSLRVSELKKNNNNNNNSNNKKRNRQTNKKITIDYIKIFIFLNLMKERVI